MSANARLLAQPCVGVGHAAPIRAAEVAKELGLATAS
jgi:hypothetical protein